MKGFDSKFSDLPTYILGMTKEIWEDRGVETLHGYYTPDIPVRSPDGAVIGNEAVIAATYATLAEFPDRQLLGEDVIWSGNDDDGFLSSHRIFSTATHLGDGAFGPATGTPLRYRVIADCAAKENQIYDEWLVRDLGAIVRQLGVDPRAFAAEQIEAQGGPGTAPAPLLDQNEPPPIYSGRGNDDPVGKRYAEALTALAVDADVDVTDIYDRAVHLELPGGLQGHGWADAEAFWSGIRASFPDASLELHHVIGRTDQGMAPRAAVRWSLNGSHDGEGAFGPPTGAEVHIMGISHAEFWALGLRREYVLFDEVAVWKQILLHAG
ncbi:MAG: ester cyclase [Acidimicrobiales bacterium]